MITQNEIHRRAFLSRLGAGMGSVALTAMLHEDSASRVRADEPTGIKALLPKKPHFPGRAKSVIFLIMEGGPSQVDTFDPKPSLNKVHGTIFERENVKSNQVKGDRYFVRSPFKFKKYGECGMDVSELFRETAEHVDDMAFVRSVYAESDNHPAALFQYNTGFPIQGNPSVGAWVTYGLGTENQNLPAFVVLRDGKPFGGTSNWGNGFLPALYQGTQFRSGDHPVLNLNPPEGVTRDDQVANLDLIESLNRRHLQKNPGQDDLEARIAAYELAFRMQTEIPEAVSIGGEPQHIHKLYGLDDKRTKDFGTRCLLARRLVERGVRFVQLWAGGWDSHDNVSAGHAAAARKVDRPIAGLLKDLKQRGLLEDTLVVWGGEFGRTVDTTEAAWNQKKPGRDHNPRAMTMWFAGGGSKGGSLVGETDEFGESAAVDPYHIHDVHATLLHLLGFDQYTFTYWHAGRDRRLTNNGGEVIEGILT